MSLFDSPPHPRESTLFKGWDMEETDISNRLALYIKLPTSAPASTVSTAIGSSSSWSFITRTDSNTSFAPSPSSAKSVSTPKLSGFKAADVDSGYGSSPEPTSVPKQKRRRRTLKKRSKSSGPATVSRPTTPTPRPSKSSSTSIEDSPLRGRGRSFKLKELGLRSWSKSREPSPTSRVTKSSTATSVTEEIPPVPVINLPIAQKFMRQNTMTIPPSLLHEIADASKDLWNDTPLLPSARRASRELHRELVASARSSKLHLPSPSDTNPPATELIVTSHTFHHRRRSLSEDVAFSVDPPPRTPAGMIQPNSFLSMSSSTVNLMQIRGKQKKRGIPGNFLSSLGRSSSNGRKESKANTSPRSKKKEQTPSSPKYILQAPDWGSENGASNRAFSFVEITEDEWRHKPWSWIEVDHPFESEAGPSAVIKPPDILLSTNTTVNVRRLSNDSDISEYDPFKAVPPGVIYSQSIPQIRRGRQAPFPINPLLPPDSIRRIRGVRYEDVPRYKGLTLRDLQDDVIRYSAGPHALKQPPPKRARQD